MSYGKAPRPQTTDRAEDLTAERPPSELPLGYYTHYGITPPKALQRKASGPPAGLLAYYGIVAEPKTAEQQPAPAQTTTPAQGAAVQAKPDPAALQVQRKPTQVSTTIKDPPYEWQSKFEVAFTDKECQLKIKVKLVPQAGVSKTDVHNVGLRAAAVFKTMWDNKFVLTDTANNKTYDLRTTAEFVDSGEHCTVDLHAGGNASTSGDLANWYVGFPDVDYAHELGHALGLKDEYIDPSAQARKDSSAPGVHTDHSIMGNYYSEGRNKAEAKLRHGQTIAGEIAGATGQKFTVTKK